MNQQTPKEKANQILNNMNGGKVELDFFDKELVKPFKGYPLDDLKRKAMIVVEEVLDEVPMYTGNLNRAWAFWDEVGTQIKSIGN